ncbi:hypothetical protein SRHO_G00242810 [Serrasalmus rhombeus]
MVVYMDWYPGTKPFFHLLKPKRATGVNELILYSQVQIIPWVGTVDEVDESLFQDMDDLDLDEDDPDYDPLELGSNED